MDTKERIENLKKQQEQARELFIKCQGAIELLEGMEKNLKKNLKIRKIKNSFLK